MQVKIRSIAAISLITAISFVSCKKTDTTTTTTDPTTELTAQTDDQSNVSSTSDAVENDVNAYLDNNAAFNGRMEGVQGMPCNATAVADSANGIRRITITYNGTSCSGKRTLTGVVVMSMPIGTHWKDAGAVLTVNTQNLKVTRVSDGKSIVINGLKTITNVSGGKLSQLSSGSITHTISGTDSVTFDNGKQRIWQVAKQRVFTYNNGSVITTTGTHTEAGVNGIAEWGTNRFGNAFVTAISQPLVIRQDCDFRLVSGTVVHSKLVADVTVTFGLDATGTPVTCPNGSFYFKAVWQGVNGVTKTVILPY
ncbi:hypothetical protein QWZ08_25095 [Ferruginibacter paludis]|uniref:hypothetical protein n=1 Tax=Ferruginibacter paludis TaxID=1310417 RepID=UPI0025B459A5|nr:hypothetical protein [Ferruginibacter paludis]MDN3658944.1 hypothetical protein [Ferruginibacter paludis]